MTTFKTKASRSCEVNLGEETFQGWIKKGQISIHFAIMSGGKEIDLSVWSPIGSKVKKKVYKYRSFQNREI